MFAQNLVLDDASGDDITFALTGTDRDGSSRVDTSSAPLTPRVLNIRHQRTGPKSGTQSDRHLAQVVQTVIDSEGRSHEIAVNFTINAPRSPAVTTQMIHDNVALIIDLLTDGALTNPMTANNLSALLRGES